MNSLYMTSQRLRRVHSNTLHLRQMLRGEVCVASKSRHGIPNAANGASAERELNDQDTDRTTVWKRKARFYTDGDGKTQQTRRFAKNATDRNNPGVPTVNPASTGHRVPPARCQNERRSSFPKEFANSASGLLRSWQRGSTYNSFKVI